MTVGIKQECHGELIRKTFIFPSTMLSRCKPNPWIKVPVQIKSPATSFLAEENKKNLGKKEKMQDAQAGVIAEHFCRVSWAKRNKSQAFRLAISY